MADVCHVCDLLLQGLQQDKVLTHPWDLVRTGVSTDVHTPRCAWAMVLSSFLYLVVQVSSTVEWSDEQMARSYVLVADSRE